MKTLEVPCGLAVWAVMLAGVCVVGALDAPRSPIEALAQIEADVARISPTASLSGQELSVPDWDQLTERSRARLVAAAEDAYYLQTAKLQGLSRDAVRGTIVVRTDPHATTLAAGSVHRE